MTEDLSRGDELTPDVVIIGYGGAGAAAAIAAHDCGAEVLLLEKMAVPGGNTRLSEVSFFTPDPKNASQAVKHIEALCFGLTGREVIQAYVDESLKNKEWIEQLGGTIGKTTFPWVRYPYVRMPAWPNIPGSEAMTNSRVVSGGVPYGARIWKLLSTNVKRRQGIRVMTRTSVKELVVNDNGEVIGVIADSGGRKISVKAKRGGVLACGGFGSNEAMKESFLPYGPFNSFGHPGNTGDGIIMAQKVGAALWHMAAIKANLQLKVPEYSAPFLVGFCKPNYIYVKKSGRRFTNETGWEVHTMYGALRFQNPVLPDYPQLPVYGICDKETLAGGPMAVEATGYSNRAYKWSKDNSAEVAKGWVIEAPTIRELARRISVDEMTLEATVARYNEHCQAGADPDFGRSKGTLETIRVAPFYAVELSPSIGNTLGGPRRDHMARIVGTEGQPIPRLYSAGELGSIWGFLYCGGGGGGESLAFGRIAGRNAAAERPWC